MSIRVLILIATTSVVLSADCFCQEESKEPFGELRIGVSPVTIVTQDLVPGAKNRVEVRLKNKTGQNLTIEEVHVSCGCIVVGELKKHLGMDEEVTVPIDLRSKLRSGRFENSITLVDSEKREWQLVLASKVIAPIISDTLQFELNGIEEQEHSFEVRVDSKHRGITGKLTDLKIESSSESIAEIGLLDATDDSGTLKIRVKLPRATMQGGFSDAIKFSTREFAFEIPVVFQFKDTVRVLAESVSRNRMRQGIQRVIAVGGEPTEREKLRVHADGVKIETELIRNGERISIFQISTSENIAHLDAVYIGFDRAGIVHPLGAIKVID